MTDPLLNPTDFASFQAKDTDWFLGAAGETIRAYCGWHIAPVVSVTDVVCKVGSTGIIMLPTLNLVSVDRLNYRGVDVATDEYEGHDSGWIQWLTSRQAVNPGITQPLTVYPSYDRYVVVDFTHGFDEVPKAVAEVGYELTSRTIEKPAGVVSDMTRGPISMKFTEFGAVLSDDQRNRLAPYVITRI